MQWIQHWGGCTHVSFRYANTGSNPILDVVKARKQSNIRYAMHITCVQYMYILWLCLEILSVNNGKIVMFGASLLPPLSPPLHPAHPSMLVGYSVPSLPHLWPPSLTSSDADAPSSPAPHAAMKAVSCALSHLQMWEMSRIAIKDLVISLISLWSFFVLNLIPTLTP